MGIGGKSGPSSVHRFTTRDGKARLGTFVVQYSSSGCDEQRSSHEIHLRFIPPKIDLVGLCDSPTPSFPLPHATHHHRLMCCLFSHCTSTTAFV